MEYGTIRNIKDDMVLSPSLPRLGIRYNPEFIYLGDLQYIGNSGNHVEEFIFLSPNSQGHAKRLLLIRFSGVLENKEGTYPGLAGETIDLAGDSYTYMISFIDLQDFLARHPGSNMAHAADYIRQRAYTLAGDMIVQSFTRRVDAEQRHEFQIAYMELNNDSNLIYETLLENPQLAKDLKQHALESFTIVK